MSDRPVRSILAFRNGSIGNTLVAVPALRALKRRHPASRLGVLVDPIGAELLRPLPFLDELIVYDRRGDDRGLSGWFRLVRRLRRFAPSHAILFKRFFRNELLALLSGASVRVGFRTAGHTPFSIRTLDYREGVSITRQNLALAALLQADPADVTPEIALTEEDRKVAAGLLAARGLHPKRFRVAHYGGLSTAPTFLPPGRFGRLIDATGDPSEPIVLVGAGARERGWGESLAAGRPRIVPLFDQPIRVTAALIESARAFVGMNSGPAHLAAAVGTPATILFRPGPGSAAEVAKWRPESDLVNAHVVDPNDA